MEECKQLTRLGLESVDMDTVALGGCPSLNQLTLRCPNLQMLDLQCAPAHQQMLMMSSILMRLCLALGLHLAGCLSACCRAGCKPTGACAAANAQHSPCT